MSWHLTILAREMSIEKFRIGVLLANFFAAGLTSLAAPIRPSRNKAFRTLLARWSPGLRASTKVKIEGCWLSTAGAVEIAFLQVS